MDTTGLDHVILTVSDPIRSRSFYCDLLGFKPFDFDDPSHSFCFSSGGVSFFFFPSNHPLPDDRFNEFRIGLDHLSFTAPSMEALQALADKLIAAGVDTRGVEKFTPTGNWYVCFRDPDNIQLEYWLP